MKYNIGDLIVETSNKYKKHWRKGYITSVTKHILDNLWVVGITWFDMRNEDIYSSESIDIWIARNNAKHYPVKL